MCPHHIKGKSIIVNHMSIMLLRHVEIIHTKLVCGLIEYERRIISINKLGKGKNMEMSIFFLTINLTMVAEHVIDETL